MEELICMNCQHSFKFHEQSMDAWFCDFADELGQWCNCNEFIKTVGKGTEEDPIEVSYDSESYRWN